MKCLSGVCSGAKRWIAAEHSGDTEMMRRLEEVRDKIAAYDDILVKALVGRAAFHASHTLLVPSHSATSPVECIERFRASTTVAGRSRAMLPCYIAGVLPLLCISGGKERANAPHSDVVEADNQCLSALVRRLALSLDVAAIKTKATPERLGVALEQRDHRLLEYAITNQGVEERVVERALKLALAHHAESSLAHRVAAVFARCVIPLSRKIQVHELMAGDTP